MPLGHRLRIISERVKAVCDFIKQVSFYLLEAGAFLVLVYLVGKAAWAGL
ncbi:MAG: hypothetical protein WAL71_15335 [Terriglobales bacterium]|jgi:hypothetical protein